MKRFIAALVALALSSFAFAAPADAACSNSGNTAGTDSAALVATLYEMCNTGAALPTGAATAANQTSANTKLDTLHTDLTTTGYACTITITRTNDTNAYTANDVVGEATGATAAKNCTAGPSGGREMMLTSIGFEIDASAIISGETSYRFCAYNVTPPSALGDNSAFDIPSGDRASFLGCVNLGTPIDEGSTLRIDTDGVNRVWTVPSGGVIYGYLVTVGAYTPTASRVYKLVLHFEAM